MDEVAVDGTYEWSPVGRRRCESKESHALQLFADLRRREAAIVGDHVAQMRSGRRRARIEHHWQTIEVFGSLAHNSR